MTWPHDIARRLMQSDPLPPVGLLFWACTMILWYKSLGWLFLPLGLYFAILVNPWATSQP